MATLLLIPREGYDAAQDGATFSKIAKHSERAAQRKTHFLITVDPKEYQVFASLGVFEEVEADETGMIRLNMTMFEHPDG